MTVVVLPESAHIQYVCFQEEIQEEESEVFKVRGGATAMTGGLWCELLHHFRMTRRTFMCVCEWLLSPFSLFVDDMWI